MRRLLAAAALAAFAAPAHATPPPGPTGYTCVPEGSDNAVCYQVLACPDACSLRPGVRVECYAGFSGERFCRIVRLVNVEIDPNDL